MIPVIWYRVDATPGPGTKPRPTVVIFHGGPAMEARRWFDTRIKVLLANGIDVLTPNVRGSTGLGRTFMALDEREQRWGAVRDGVACGRWLRAQGVEEIVAMGNSYGGWEALAVVMEAYRSSDSNLWSAAISINGIVDWPNHVATTAPWRRGRYGRYGNIRDPEALSFLEAISPLRHADEITVPALLVGSQRDTKVGPQLLQPMAGRLPRHSKILLLTAGHDRPDNPVDEMKVMEGVMEFLQGVLPTLPGPATGRSDRTRRPVAGRQSASL